jgi:hypothetical protein
MWQARPHLPAKRPTIGLVVPVVAAVTAIMCLGIHAQNAWGPLAFEAARQPRRVGSTDSWNGDAERRDLLRRDLGGRCEIAGATRLRGGTWSVWCTSGVLLVLTYDRDGALQQVLNSAELTASASPQHDGERLRLFSELVPSRCSVVSTRLSRTGYWTAECRSGDRVHLKFTAQGIPSFIGFTR